MVSEQDRLAKLVAHGSLWLVLASFFGFGLLLAFTPCVLPMIPILSGIIAGQGEQVTPMRGFLLSLSYVMGMALTYTIAGAAFAAAGQQAQAIFQQPWILALFALMFVGLALAMFGFYELQLPAGLQTRLNGVSGKLSGGKVLSTALMGALSSLVVTACVAPPLVAALAVISQTGSVLRGGLALFSLSIGMGAPLLVVGASAGKLLPRAGAWMETVKQVFGVLFLGVAVWMAERILPAPLVMVLWAGVAGAALWVFWPPRGWRPFGAGLALRGLLVAAAALWGLALLVGAGFGGKDPLRPFEGTRFGAATPQALVFTRIHSVADLERELAAAKAAGRRVMVDFSAEWCVSCKEMEKYTFRDPAVQAALAPYVLLQADVTANSADDEAMLQRFAIFGPPTTAFFGPEGRERTDFRLVGFVAADAFRAHLARLENTP
jgi:thiol:disulfide interchange protein DsbD